MFITAEAMPEGVSRMTYVLRHHPMVCVCVCTCAYCGAQQGNLPMMTWTRMESLVLKTITVDLQERDRERERDRY